MICLHKNCEQMIAKTESKIEDKESDIEIHNLTVKLNYLKKARDYYFNEREAHNG